MNLRASISVFRRLSSFPAFLLIQFSQYPYHSSVLPSISLLQLNGRQLLNLFDLFLQIFTPHFSQPRWAQPSLIFSTRSETTLFLFSEAEIFLLLFRCPGTRWGRFRKELIRYVLCWGWQFFGICLLVGCAKLVLAQKINHPYYSNLSFVLGEFLLIFNFSFFLFLNYWTSFSCFGCCLFPWS